MHKPASLLASDVKDELDWDPLLDAKRILVEAERRTNHPDRRGGHILRPDPSIGRRP